LIGWLLGLRRQLVDWLTGWLAGWLAGWLVGWLLGLRRLDKPESKRKK
jgi:hypothetical protein